MAVKTQARTVVVPITAQQSQMAIKNSIRIALSSVCYFRNLFPDSIFKPKEYCGLELMIFHPDVKKSTKLNSNAYNLIQTFEKGVFDALQKKYLERLLLNIHSEDPLSKSDAEVLESYSFKFSYNDQLTAVNGNSIGRSKSQIQASTRSLLKKMVTLTSGLEELPSKTWISVNLVYNKTTPKNYEPAFFEPIKKMNLPDFKNPPLSVDLGQTDTGFDRVVIKLRTPDRGDTETVVGIDPEATIDERKYHEATEPEREEQSLRERKGKRVRKSETVEQKFNKMKLNNQRPQWTQDTIQANLENTDPTQKASRGKRKILCEVDRSRKRQAKNNRIN